MDIIQKLPDSKRSYLRRVRGDFIHQPNCRGQIPQNRAALGKKLRKIIVKGYTDPKPHNNLFHDGKKDTGPYVLLYQAPVGISNIRPFCTTIEGIVGVVRLKLASMAFIGSDEVLRSTRI